MINVLVMTHGEMAEGICKTINMVIGDQKNFSYLAFKPDQSLDSLIEALKAELNEFDNDHPNLVLVDLFAGSPSNAIVHLLAEGYRIHSLSGVNLPMLITALTERESYPIVEEFIQEVKSAGFDGVINIVEKIMED